MTEPSKNCIDRKGSDSTMLPRHYCSPDGTWQVVKSQICPLAQCADQLLPAGWRICFLTFLPRWPSLSLQGPKDHGDSWDQVSHRSMAAMLWQHMGHGSHILWEVGRFSRDQHFKVSRISKVDVIFLQEVASNFYDFFQRSSLATSFHCVLPSGILVSSVRISYTSRVVWTETQTSPVTNYFLETQLLGINTQAHKHTSTALQFLDLRKRSL